MCYTAESLTLKAYRYAIHRGDANFAEELARKLHDMDPLKFPYYHVSAFAHPLLLVFTNEAPMEPQFFTWGLIPAWIKSEADARKVMKQTLNARGETIFEKPAFENSARNKRCLVYLDAFYEFHHANSKTYPFRIGMKDGSPLAIAGLWESWTNRETGEIVNTVTLVTITGNKIMSRVHNNPAAEMGPRMPVILPKEKQDEWLIPCRTDVDKKHLQELIRPLHDGLLYAYSVGRIKGKEAIGNTAEAEKEFLYEELGNLVSDDL
jgi:putative SOS response-associated peptidase YedK